MTRGNKILLSAIIGGSALAYLIYRKLQKDSLYDEILKKIGIGESFGHVFNFKRYCLSADISFQKALIQVQLEIGKTLKCSPKFFLPLNKFQSSC